MPTFDGDNLIMTLDAPVDGVLSLDTQADWYSEWKKWSLLDDNLKYEKAFDIIISEELTPGIESGAYFFFRNDSGWRVRPFEANATIYLNGNLVPRDSSLPIMIPTIGTYTVLLAGLQPITQNIDTIKTTLEIPTHIGKEGLGITIDPLNGTDSSAFPYGNVENPCKTEANIIAIEADRGYRNIYVKTSLTIAGDHSADVNVWFGHNPQTVVVTLDPACNVTGAKFQDCYITGKFDSANIVWECIVGSITNANGFIYKSTIIGPIVVSGTVSMEDCWTATPGTDNIIDFNSTANTVALTDWSGGTILVKNMVAGCVLGMGGTSGSLSLDSSCTGGSINHGGAIRIKSDLSTGTTINDASTATQAKIAILGTEAYP